MQKNAQLIIAEQSEAVKVFTKHFTCANK